MQSAQAISRGSAALSVTEQELAGRQCRGTSRLTQSQPRLPLGWQQIKGKNLALLKSMWSLDQLIAHVLAQVTAEVMRVQRHL